MSASTSTPTRRTTGPGARRGLGLLEAAFGLTLMSVAAAGLFGIVNDQAMASKANLAAERLVQIGDAAEAYIRANREELRTAAAAGPVRIEIARRDSADPVPQTFTVNGVTLRSLQWAGFLPRPFVDRNAFGTSHTLVVRLVGNEVVGMVSTLQPPNRQGNMSNRTLGRIVAKAGARAGMYMTHGIDRSGTRQFAAGPRANNWVQGAAGGWTAFASSYTADGEGPTMGSASMLLSSNGDAIAGDFLNRRDVGNPEANRMRTDLLMGGTNAIREAVNVQAPRTTNGDATMVSIDGDPTGATVNTVRVGPNMRVDWNARVGRDLTVNGNALVGGGASVNGTLDSRGYTLMRQNARVMGQLNGDGRIVAGTDVVARRDVSAVNDVTAGERVRAKNVQASERGFFGIDVRTTTLLGTELYDATTLATERYGPTDEKTRLYVDADGDGIPEDGGSNWNVPLDAYRLTPAGFTNLNEVDANLLSVNPFIADGPAVADLNAAPGIGDPRFPKNSGVRLKDLLPEYVLRASYQAYPGATVVPKPTCGGVGAYKGEPKIILTPMADSFQMPSSLTLNADRNAADEVTISADLRTSNAQYTWSASNFASAWVVRRGGNANISGRPWRALAQVYCYYGNA